MAPGIPPSVRSVQSDWSARIAELKAQYLAECEAPRVEPHLSLKLKPATAHPGTINSLTASEIEIERGSITMGLTQSQLSTALSYQRIPYLVSEAT